MRQRSLLNQPLILTELIDDGSGYLPAFRIVYQDSLGVYELEDRILDRVSRLAIGGLKVRDEGEVCTSSSGVMRASGKRAVDSTALLPWERTGKPQQ